jgi:hypothetical protein
MIKHIEQLNGDVFAEDPSHRMDRPTIAKIPMERKAGGTKAPKRADASRED